MGRLFEIVDNFGETDVRFVCINRVSVFNFGGIFATLFPFKCICNEIYICRLFSRFAICYIMMWIINNSWDTSYKRLNFY